MSASIPALKLELYRLSHEHGFREILNELVYIARTTQQIEASEGRKDAANAWWETATAIRQAEELAKSIKPAVRQ